MGCLLLIVALAGQTPGMVVELHPEDIPQTGISVEGSLLTTSADALV